MLFLTKPQKQQKKNPPKTSNPQTHRKLTNPHTLLMSGKFRSIAASGWKKTPKPNIYELSLFQRGVALFFSILCHLVMSQQKCQCLT